MGNHKICLVKEQALVQHYTHKMSKAQIMFHKNSFTLISFPSDTTIFVSYHPLPPLFPTGRGLYLNCVQTLQIVTQGDEGLQLLGKSRTLEHFNKLNINIKMLYYIFLFL